MKTNIDQERLIMLLIMITLNMKVMVIKVRLYLVNNILIRSDNKTQNE